MKICVFFWSLLVTLQACFAAEPAGEFVELHSCDLYTGGCTASSESTLLGRQLLRVWSIEEGTWNNQNLAGLKVALLELGSVNLAEKGALGDKAELFVPKGLAPVQKDALLSWVSSQAITPASTQVCDAEITYQRIGPAANVTVGDSIVLSTMPIAKCNTGACGQALWYEPQVKYSSFEVLASRVSRIQEPALNFLWTDHDRPNVFLASFGPHGIVARAETICR
ncbi:MAG TPA: hypothetical protein VE860_24615 [Chthoniobacterales bacterium]|nr:hypothetical protein [Chthoniobacterales bacterium]